MPEHVPDLAGEVERLRADLAASQYALTSLQGYVQGLRCTPQKLADELALAQRETEAARAAEPPWRGMWAEVRSAVRRFCHRTEEIAG